MSKRAKVQEAKVARWLGRRRWITGLVAMNKLKIYRLSAVILKLRRGWALPISTIMRETRGEGGNSRFAEYRLNIPLDGWHRKKIKAAGLRVRE